MRRLIYIVMIGLVLLLAGCTREVTVTYHTQGGTELDPVSIVRGTVISRPEDPVKEGVVFDGWYTDREYKNSFEESFDKVKVTKSLNLYAKWVDPISFEINQDQTGYRLVGVHPSVSTVYIPEEYKGLPIIEIDPRAFTKLNERVIEVNIPKTIQGIDVQTFNELKNLKRIEVHVDNLYYSSFKGVLYDRTQKELISFPRGRVDEEFTVPLSIESIGNYAFWGTQLKTIIVNENIREIGEYAFEYARIEKIIFDPSSDLRTIKFKAFSNAQIIEPIHFPTQLEVIEEQAFSSAKLSKVTFENSPSQLQILGNLAFHGSQMEEIILPPSLKSLSYGTFSNATITKVSFDNGSKLTQIDGFSFYGSRIEIMNLPQSIMSINSQSFGFAHVGTMDFEVDSVLSTIDYRAFYSSHISHLVLPRSLTFIGYQAFQDGTLGHIEFEVGSNLQQIGSGAFQGAQLTSIIIPKSVKEIEEFAFYQSSLSSLTFEADSELSIIHSFAFADTPIQSVELPKDMLRIGHQVFYGDALLVIYFLSPHPVDLGDMVFNQDVLEIIYVPKGTLIDYRNDEKWSRYADILQENE